MKKQITAFLLVICICFCLMPPVSAHDDQAKHDGDLKLALFGDRNKILTGRAKTVFRAIANASALCIDQFSPNMEVKWKYGTFETLRSDLDTLGLPQLSIIFSEIDLNASINNGDSVTANTHRSFTHMGWNYNKYPNPDFWAKRKSVLTDVINRVLFYPKRNIIKVPWLSDVVYNVSEQCDAFSAVVYYIHILGDHIEGDDPSKLTDLEPLIQYLNTSSPGIITELQEQLQILFVDQRGTRTFIALQQDLSDLRIVAEQNCGMWRSIDTREKCIENQKNANRLLEILGTYLPHLLQHEFFFYSNFAS